MENIRVLHITGMVDRKCGSTNVMLHISKELQQHGIIFDYLALKGFDVQTKEEIEHLGGVVHDFPDSPHKNPVLRQLDFLKYFREFIHNHSYTVLHWDTENPIKALQLFIAKKAGVSKRIIHSHAAGVQNVHWIANLICGSFRELFRFCATDYIACSWEAAQWMFPRSVVNGKQFVLLKNGIDTKQFVCTPNKKEESRKKIGLKDELVLGHVGRFAPIKNHVFLLKVLHYLKFEKQQKVKLLLVGEGELMDEIKQKSAEMSLEQEIIYAGTTEKVQEYLWAMDVFLFPSIKEGLGMAAVEAQTAGVPCILSKGIPKEAKILENTVFLDLSEEIWGDAVLRLKQHNYMEKGAKQAAEMGYDIYDVAVKLKKVYTRK